MPPDRSDAAREERLAELLEEFRVRKGRQTEAIAALDAAVASAKRRIARAVALKGQADKRMAAVEKQIERLKRPASRRTRR